MASFSGIACMLCVVFCLIFLFIGDDGVCAKGGRGGGRSRSGGRRSRSGSRSISVSRVRYGPGSRGWRWQVAGTAGYIYGYSYYQTRWYYRRNPNTAPSICVNKYDYKMENGTNFELLICPHEGQADNYYYCCGSGDREWCCSTWQRPGTIVGLVAGSLFGLMLIIWCVSLTMKKTDTVEVGKYYRSTFRRTDRTGDGQQTYPTSLQTLEIKPSTGDQPMPTHSTNGVAPYPTADAPEFQIGTSYPFPTGTDSKDQIGSILPFAAGTAAPYPTADGPPYTTGTAPPYPTETAPPYPTVTEPPHPDEEISQRSDGPPFHPQQAQPYDPSCHPSVPPPAYPGSNN